MNVIGEPMASAGNSSLPSSESQRLQIRLAKLLQIKRDSEGSRLVSSILTSSSSLEEKIRRIKTVDQGDLQGASEALDVKDPQAPKSLIAEEQQKEEEEYLMSDPALSLMEVEKNRRHQKVILKNAGFFSFLFRELGPITRFGSNTHTLDTGFFPFQLRIHRDIPYFFEDRFKSQLAKPLADYLNLGLRKAWVYLTKQEYNLLDLLKRLAENILDVPFKNFNLKNRRLIDRLTSIENLFFSFYSHKDYIHWVEKGLEAMESKINLPGRKKPNLLKLGRRLLYQDLTKPSLYNLIRALNMFKYHRFLELEDLYFTDLPPLISDDDFDTSPEIRQDILAHIADLERSLKPLLMKHKEVLSIQSFIPTSFNGDIDYGPLEGLYSMYTENDKPSNLFLDRSNLISNVVKLLISFLKYVEPIIHGQIKAVDGRFFAIFDVAFYGNIISRIHYNLTKLEKIQVVMPTFSEERYRHLKQTRKGAIPNEAEILEAMDGVLGDMFSLGESLKDVLVGRMPSTPGVESLKSISTIAFQKKTYFIPMEYTPVDGEGIFFKKTPPELLTLVIQICYLTYWLFDHTELKSKLQSKDRIHKKSKMVMATIRRLAGRAHYHKILKDSQP
jgi:hypothetical protein